MTGEKEQEYGVPYGKYAVNADMDYINSDRFAKKFYSITANKAVNETLLECARNAIAHRNGTLFEDMYIINGNTGEIMARQLDMKAEKGISHSHEINAAIFYALDENIPIIAFHSHPEGYPPSVDDFNSAYDYGYTLGIVVGHNGQVYVYSNNKGTVDDVDSVQLNIVSTYFRGYDIDRAYREVYNEIGFSYRIVKEEYL